MQILNLPIKAWIRANADYARAGLDGDIDCDPYSLLWEAVFVGGTILTHTHLSLTSVRFSVLVLLFHLSILSCLHLF